jgi:hypothetical protein
MVSSFNRNRPKPPYQQVRCDGEEFEMHAIVVTCDSEHFRAMLEHAMVERGSRTFEMHDIRPRVRRRTAWRCGRKRAG